MNHKKVKQLLNEKRSRISDRQFFSSRILAGHYEDMAAAQTRRYHYNRRVRVKLYWAPKDGNLACTDNLLIRINAGHPLVTRIRGRENRYRIVTGLFAHELGHVLYTDFLAGQTYLNALTGFRWYPNPPALKTTSDLRNEAALWDYVRADAENAKLVCITAHQISNILEDGYIENRILNSFPGVLGYALEELRETMHEDIPTVTQLIEREETGETHVFESILQLLLSYTKYGEIRYGEEPLTDERVQLVFSLLPEIDQVLMTRSGKERLQTVSLILVRCWEYIQAFLECCKDRRNVAASAGDCSTASEVLEQILGVLAGNSDISTGDSTPVSEEGDAPGTLIAAESREKTRKEADEKETPGEDDDAKPGSTRTGEEPLETEAAPGPTTLTGTGKQGVSESEQGRIDLKQTEGCAAPDGGSVAYDSDYRRELDEHAASDIERILDKMAERAACKELENERLKELNEAAGNIDYGDAHAGVHIRVNRIASVDDELIEQYDQISAPLLTISRQLQKNLVQQLREERRGGKQTGLLMGRRLDSHTLHRNDGKIFYKNALPAEMPELAVGLLLDESGSMSARDRCTYARAAAIILYDFCQSLGIPIMVYGHTTGYSEKTETVELYSYAEFESIDRDDKYRMMDIAARNCNRDGAALRFVAERLSRRTESIKLLILVSDGQPSSIGYGGTAAEEDLRGIQREYQRKGILFVAAAVGDDKPCIERIYGDSYLDITDLNQLPVKLTAVVRRHIRV